jgi:hypothetical protein
MSKPMEASSGARPPSQQIATDQKKPCDTCCDLNPLCPVEPSKTKKIGIYRGNRCITLRETLGAYETSTELGCPICGLLAAIFDQFWPGQKRDAQVSLGLEENTPPQLRTPTTPLLRVSFYTSTRVGKCTLSTQRWRSLALLALRRTDYLFVYIRSSTRPATCSCALGYQSV